MSNQAAISVEGICKRYRLGVARHDTLRDRLAHAARAAFRRSGANTGPAEEFWALRDVSFRVERGEVLGIIGRNGAGKSTLLKILSRITEPTAGRIALHGRVASLLEVGTGFHPELSGRENIYLNGAILGMSRAEIRRKFDEIVAFAEVEQFLDTPVKHYSSGMYVRLAFAVAAHLEPEILIVDEVLAVGDAAFQRKCLGRIERMSTREGSTVLLVSHNMASVEVLATTAIWLDRGHLLAVGSASEVCSQYLAANRPQQGDHGVVVQHRAEFGFNDFAWEAGPVARRSDRPILFEFTVAWSAASEVDVLFDYGIHNIRGDFVVHLQGVDTGTSARLVPGESRRIRVRIEPPYLAPGDYDLTIFVYPRNTGNSAPLLWIEKIPGLRITSENHLGGRALLAPTRGMVLPKIIQT